MGELARNLELTKERIVNAALKCGRAPKEIRLIAVSKTKSYQMIQEAYDAGQRIFGESYAQELQQKAEALSDKGIEWHFIGHLQRNKVKYITPVVKCIHSLDSIRLAEEIDKRAEYRIDCLIEVNLAGELSKTGISTDDLNELILATRSLKNLRLIGLMTMPPPDTEKSRPYFSRLRKLMHDINEAKIYPTELTELSMGMTADLEVAIEEGSTIVRVGTAIFGERE